MSSTAPKLRRRPPQRQKAIQDLISERGTIARRELLQWARESGFIDRRQIGLTQLRTVLIRLRAKGLVDYSPQEVWLGRNPAKDKNLSREFVEAREKFQFESRKAISSIVQSLAEKRACHGIRESRHEGLAR